MSIQAEVNDEKSGTKRVSGSITFNQLFFDNGSTESSIYVYLSPGTEIRFKGEVIKKIEKRLKYDVYGRRFRYQIVGELTIPLRCSNRLNLKYIDHYNALKAENEILREQNRNYVETNRSLIDKCRGEELIIGKNKNLKQDNVRLVEENHQLQNKIKELEVLLEQNITMNYLLSNSIINPQKTERYADEQKKKPEQKKKKDEQSKSEIAFQSCNYVYGLPSEKNFFKLNNPPAELVKKELREEREYFLDKVEHPRLVVDDVKNEHYYCHMCGKQCTPKSANIHLKSLFHREVLADIRILVNVT